MHYTYHGPQTAGTLADGRDVILHPGCRIEMDADCPWVQTLVGLDRLRSADDSAPAPASVAAKASTDGKKAKTQPE